MDHLFSYISFLETLRFSNLRIECSCGDDFQILGIISIKFLKLFIGYINEF